MKKRYRKSAVRRRAHHEAGFSLLETIVAAGLLVLATTGTLLVLIGSARLNSEVLERSRLATVVENFLTDIKTGATYAGTTNTQLLQGDIPQNLELNDEQTSFPCALQRMSPQSPWIMLQCTSIHGYRIQRIVRIIPGVPVPNSFMTADP